MGTHDFSRLPTHLQPVGTPVQVVTMRATSTAPDVSRQQQNEAALKRFRELQAMRPKATTPTPAPKPSLPTAEESERLLQSARADLKSAIEARDEMQRTVDDAADAVRRAREDADAIRGSIREMGNIDHMISLWRADRLKRGKDASVLPDDLRRKRDERARLLQEASDADGAVGVLAADHEAAQSRLTDMQGHVAAVGRRVLQTHAARLAAEVSDLQREAFQKKEN